MTSTKIIGKIERVHDNELQTRGYSSELGLEFSTRIATGEPVVTHMPSGRSYTLSWGDLANVAISAGVLDAGHSASH